MTYRSIARAAWLAALLSSLLSVRAASAQVEGWILDDGESLVRFTCVGPEVVDAAKGRFAAVLGQIALDPQSLSTARGAVGVLLASIATELPGWDAMFRGAGFLELDRYPRAIFELDAVRGATALRAGEWVQIQLAGRLTVHGIRRDVVLPTRARWTPASGDTPERLEVLTTLQIRWPDHEIMVPAGWTRRFAGDAAQVRVKLVFDRPRR